MFSNKCEKCLQYNPKFYDYDPFMANPDFDIDVQVDPNSIIEL